eukprot:Phypoly_transcript_13616.p2 GENE.Phypoly_transcript_13616~~Phypoly_transcript_13616.p2  ORF type:complete len:119 (+),score=22.79 Phypoly_transcript_13616:258-614(+)
MFNYLLSQKFVGDMVKVTILRDGKVMDMQVPISVNKLLVPVHQFEKFPSYFVYAGLVFIPLVQPYLHEWDDWYNNSPRKLCDKAINGIKIELEEEERKEKSGGKERTKEREQKREGVR